MGIWKDSTCPSPTRTEVKASRVRILSSIQVVMSAAFVDPQHTTEEKEGISIANCWKSKEKKEESHGTNNICSIDFKMADDDDIVEHFEILNNKTKTITEWTTIETGKNAWAWAGAVTNEKEGILGHSSSKNVVQLYCIACI